jgi:type IV pilus assembly protein PilY1
MEAGIMKYMANSGCRGLGVLLLAASLVMQPVWADDAELYFRDAPPDAPPPLVMLTLDMRPNLGAPACTGDVNSASCRDSFCGTAKEDPGCTIGQGIYDALYPGAPQVDGVYTGEGEATGAVSNLQAFVAAFRYILFTLGVFDGMKVGLMMNHDQCQTGGCGGKSNGGYVLRGFELLEKEADSNGAKQELLDIFAAQPTNLVEDKKRPTGSEAHPYQGRELFFELYRYMAGLDVLNGKLGSADFGSALPGGTADRNLDYEFSTGFGGPPAIKCAFTTGVNSGDNRLCEDYIKTKNYTPAAGSNLGKGGVRISSALTWDPTVIQTVGSKDRYVSPYNDNDNDEDWSCSGAYSINMLFAVSNHDDQSDTPLAAPLSSQGLALPKPTGKPDPITGKVDGFSQIIAKLSGKSDPEFDIAGGQADGVPSPAGKQRLTSFFLTLDTGPVTSKGNDYAQAGLTDKAIPALGNPVAMVNALRDIANQINSVSRTFVAVTVPVNADNRVTALPHMFVALFQVDEDGRPNWSGNVKKLDVVVAPDEVTGEITLNVLDANGNPAFDPLSGRIKPSALTLWTKPDDPSMEFENLDPEKGPILVSERDGSAVRRGGAGQKVPGYLSGSVGESNVAGARQIFLSPETFSGTALAGNDLVPLDASDESPLLTDPYVTDIQSRLGLSGDADSCAGKASEGYCVRFASQVLDVADIGYPDGTPSTVLTDADIDALTLPQKQEMAKDATQVFLKWIRGIDVFDNDGDKDRSERRPWLMGDVLHSRPLAINYGARDSYGEQNQDVRLVFGANDGLLRMVRNTMPSASEPTPGDQENPGYGEEVWAFMPRELLAQVPQWAMGGRVELNRPYGVDGEPALLTIDTNRDGIIDNNGSCTVGADDCDRAWVYFGLRRGGKAYYALDVSNPDAASPKLLWKVDDSMTDFTELGLTFSTPRVGWVQLEDAGDLNLFGADNTNVPIPVVIVGGGYHGHAVEPGDCDPVPDDHHVCGADSKDKLSYYGGDAGEGNAVFIIHARTGELIWKVTGGPSSDADTHAVHPQMKHGIAAAVAPMDANGNGILDRLYVPDTGGRVWRIDIPEFVKDVSPEKHRKENWKATLLADLRPSDDALASSTDDDLRFFHSATIVRRARDGIGVYDAIAVGSGDREHPQSETNKNNWFFLFKDRNVISGDPAVAGDPSADPPVPARAALAPGDLTDITNQCLNVTAGVPCTADLTHGWRLALEEKGEKNLSSPFIGGNGIIFTTYLPEGQGEEADPCVPEGLGRLYQVGLASGEPLPFLHGEQDSYSKDHRWIELYPGIDGGVVAVSPDFWITSTGKSGGNPAQKPIQFYWRESGIDTVQ